MKSILLLSAILSMGIGMPISVYAQGQGCPPDECKDPGASTFAPGHTDDPNENAPGQLKKDEQRCIGCSAEELAPGNLKK